MLVCITKWKVVGEEIMVLSSRIFQLTSVPLGCVIYQAILLVKVPVSVDGTKLWTVSTPFLLFHTLISKIAHIRMTVSKGKKLMAFRNLCGQCEYLLFVIQHADFPRLYDSVI